MTCHCTHSTTAISRITASQRQSLESPAQNLVNIKLSSASPAGQSLAAGDASRRQLRRHGMDPNYLVSWMALTRRFMSGVVMNLS